MRAEPNKGEIRSEYARVLALLGRKEEAKKEMPPEEAKEGAEFLRRFTLLELRKTGDNLLLHYRFTVGTKTVSQKVMLKPGTTADEILQAATDGNN